MFYLVCNNLEERTRLISHLKQKGIMAVFHYLSLHKSDFFAQKHDDRVLSESDRYSDCLLRLPLYFDLSKQEISRICEEIIHFYEN